MIFVNRVITEYLRNHYDVIVFKKDKRHLTGNRESIILKENGNQYMIGRCVVKRVLDNVDVSIENNFIWLLSFYLEHSGYDDFDKWYKYIIDEIYNGKTYRSGFLYKIERFCFYEYNIPLLK